jgi:hypothetical protein
VHGVDSYKTNVIRDIAVRGLGEVNVIREISLMTHDHLQHKISALI